MGMLIGRCVAKIAAALIAFLAVLSFSASSASAETPSPWFHLASVSRPGNLQPAKVEVDEVQELAVTATGGEVALVEPVSLEEVLKGEPVELLYATFAYNADHEEVQSRLEGLYGKGNLKVTGGPEGKPATVAGEPYKLTFTGGLGDRPVALYNTEFSAAFGLQGTATMTQVTQGAFEGSRIAVTAINLGDATAQGGTAPVKLVDRLPHGLRAVIAEGNSTNNGSESRGPVACAVLSAHEVQCTLAKGAQHDETGTLPPYEQIEAVIGVAPEAGAASGEVNEVSASGGGAPVALLRHPLTVAKAPAEPTPFGVEAYEQTFEGVGGAPDAQAGSHPFQFTTTLDLNETGAAQPAALAKDLSFRLPAGLVGNPTAYPRCTLAQFSTILGGVNECPANSVLGVAVVSYLREGRLYTSPNPIFNLEPSPGEPARFGFQPAGVPVFLDTLVRTGEDYGVTVHAENVPETIGFVANTVTFWGVPGDRRHDTTRGGSCLLEAFGMSAEEFRHLEIAPCRPLEEANPPPFLALPTSCTGPLLDTGEVDSWEPPHTKLPFSSEPRQAPQEGSMPAMDGCGLLAFGSEIKVSSDEETASTPSGLRVDVHVPQEEALNPKGLAPADVRNITVALPAGVALNPAAGDGLQACSEEQVGLHNDNEASCPNASKIATATITTPLLPNSLKGFVYLASPQNFAGPLENQFGSLVAMYLVARDPISGTLVKLAGRVSLSSTGQITATFQNNPQLPFEDAELEFFGGERAPLATPARCGSYTTNASFEPWSNTTEHEEVLHSSSVFNITSGLGGAACPGPALAFAPSLASETTNINAGSFTPLATTMSREDGQQSIQSVTLHYPPGLSGLLSGVKLCPEAQANAGTCGPESEIGETIVSVGLGGDPFTVTGGKVYLTEKYAGAPFGLSIVNPAKAGPFDLQEGRPVVVRATVEVNPITAALTIATDSSGAHAIPTIIEGIPLQIKHVNVTINRPGFTFNPTNCTPTAVTGAISSAEGASSPVSVPFQVTNCAVLKFAPKFAVSTSGKTSRANGASLYVKLVYPKAAFGSQANIRSVKVNLPKQLPSRLTTLQKACRDSTFNANPAACPAASRIGTAKATTPLIPVPLTGPVYFVSHGGAKFPELIVVLSGYGVTVDLHSETFISKAGITSSTFRTIPDVPVGTFELTLPEGKFSALAANGNLCKSKLAMPTAFTAQNGAVIHQSTPINVTGCKPSIAVMSQSVKGNTATIVASVPSAGKLVASGAEIKRSVKRVAKAGTVTIGVMLTSHGLRVLARNPHQRINANVKLRFTPEHGAPLTAYVRLLLG